MSRFKIGGKCICINGNQWYIIETGEPCEGPYEGEILDIYSMSDDMLFFEKYGLEDGFIEYSFAPIEEYTDSLSIAESLVKELSEVDKAKNPIKELENA